MKFNYKLKRFCGAYYGYPLSTEMIGGSQWAGSNVIYDSTGNRLVSAVSNRVQVIDLHSQTVRTLPIEARSSIRSLALSPDDSLLVTVDVKHYAMLVNFARGIVLHRWHLGDTARDLQFSPNGAYIAVTHGKHLQVWRTPSVRKEFAPLVLHRTYTGPAEDLTCLAWSSDSSVLAAGSRDCSVRIWTVHTTRNFEPMTLASHKGAIVGVALVSSHHQGPLETVYSVSSDGTLVTWEWCRNPNNAETPAEPTSDPLVDEAVDFFTGTATKRRKLEAKSQAHALVGGSWRVQARHYFHQDGASVTAANYCPQGQLLAVGFSSGLFGLYEMPSVANIHTLSVGSNQLIKSCVLNKSGEWLALACPASQQLFVWEWRSETYVLKQRGHAYGMRSMAYSPDGIVICTGGEDGKVKLWNATSGFCYVTLEKTHTAPITAVAFANASVVLTASLDGTVRAHDLHRYRTFRTLTSPTPVQFLSLSCDPSGEVVCAGSTDPFHVYAWNLQTGKLLDIYTGHTGPVCSLAFQSTGGILASASWDGTVRIWDLYKGNVPTETFQHTSDVVCLAFRPDGKEICTGTVAGLLSFWNVEDGKLKFEIDGRRDVAGGRKMNDRMTADNNASTRYFTSVCYSADGSCILAGGNSKYVCIYEISQQVLLKKYQITFNRSLDGVLDELNSKNLADGGAIDDHEESGDETSYNALQLPGARRGDDGSRRSRIEVLTRQLSFSSTAREWAVVSGEGLHVYSLDEDMVFDPISLTEAMTPASVYAKIASGEWTSALQIALHLNEFSLMKQVLEQTPFASIAFVVKSVGPEQLERLLQAIAKICADSPHIEFYLEWCLQLLQTHGMFLDKNRGAFMRAFRAMHKALQSRHDDLKIICNENKYTLDYLADHGLLMLEQQREIVREE